MNTGFWKNRNVLITGFAGFLGSNLTSRLLTCAGRIAGLDIRVSRKNTRLTPAEQKKIVAVKGSVTNYELVRKIIKDYKISVIFHLAAEALVEQCNNNPARAFKSNIEGTWNILEAARQSPQVKAVVVASSDKAYGAHKKLPYRENTPLRGDHPYDVSKSCADLIAYTYFHTYGLPAAVTRCGNIYGPGDFNFSRIIPDAIRSAICNRPLIIRSDGKFTRDYVYVDDIVNGYIMLAEQLQKKGLGGEAFNFSTENPITVIELIKKICRISGNRLNYKILNKAKYEIKHQYLYSRKARETLNWKPRHGLEEGLEKAFKWYSEYFDR